MKNTTKLSILSVATLIFSTSCLFQNNAKAQSKPYTSIVKASLMTTSQLQANIIEKVLTIKPKTIAQSKIPTGATVMPAESGIVNPGGRIDQPIVGRVRYVAGEISGADEKAKQIPCNALKVELSAFINREHVSLGTKYAKGKTLGSTCKYIFSPPAGGTLIRVSASEPNYSTNSGGYSGGTQLQPASTFSHTTINFQVGYVPGLH
jgi:hypothetical protein